QPADFPVQIPASLVEIAQAVSLVRRTGDVLHDVAEVKAKRPRFDGVDDLDGAERVMRRAVDQFVIVHERKFSNRTRTIPPGTTWRRSTVSRAICESS